MSILLIIPIILGLLAGWLVNYIADVLPLTRRFSAPTCTQCQSQFSIKDYLLIRPCPNGHTRGVRFWLVLALMIAISIFVWLQPPARLGFFPGYLLTIYFGIVIVIDLEHRLILHPTSVVGALLALTFGILSRGWKPALLGGLAGFLIMLAFYLLGVLFTRLRTKRLEAQGQPADEEEALGAGDVILVTILGFLVGWPLIWFLVLFSILLGGIVSFLLVAGLLITRKYEKNALMMFIPYGPYFVISAFLITFVPRFLAVLIPG